METTVPPFEPPDSINPYDRVPYEGQAIYWTHPNIQGVVATLYGLEVAPVDASRILYIGCARGENLIPMAVSLPGSRFLGIDASRREIDEADRTIRSLGLRNVEVRHLDLRDVADELGEFDQIICHGVFSWVAADVQDRILDLCRRCLADAGVAHISHNSYPGWHLSRIVGDILRFGGRGEDEPGAMIRGGRELLERVTKCRQHVGGSLAELLRRELAHVRNETDSFLFHDLLEVDNHPIYFHQFVDRLHARGLEFVADAQLDPVHFLATERGLAKLLPAIAGDWVRREQLADFLAGRYFRRSLIARQDRSVDRERLTQNLARVRIASFIRPVEREVDLSARTLVRYRGYQGDVVTRDPILKLAYSELAGRWPRSIAFAELWEAVRGRITDAGTIDPAVLGSHRERLARSLLSSFSLCHIFLELVEPRLVVEPPDRPVASPIARWQVESGCERLTNLRHFVLALREFDREVLRRLDGSRSRDALVREMVECVASGRVRMADDPSGTVESRNDADAVRLRVERSVKILTHGALLIG